MFALVLLFSTYALVAAATCTNNPPLQLPVTNVDLSNGQVMRGVWTSIGTPAQNISMFPKVFLNDTWVYNASAPFCSAADMDLNADECTILRGGLYNPHESSSAVTKENVYAAGADASDTARSNDGSTHIWFNDWVQDDFHLGDTTLQAYPVGMAGMDISSQWLTMANLGLNWNSTVLTALKSAGRTASRSYSWWWGINSGPNQMDGSIVFGGYDAAKTSGQNFSLPVVASTLGCPGGMFVTVTDLQLNFKNGSDASLMGGKPAFSACLEPDWSTVISFDESYYQTFAKMTQTQQIGREGGAGLTFWGLLYSPDDVYDGALTITLNNAFSVEIPNDILVISPQHVESDGSFHTNDSVRELLINPLVAETADFTPYIGKQFFSQTYLTVDFDASTFYLSKAVATDQSELVRIGEACSITTKSKDVPSSATAGSQSSAGATISQGLSRGAIAGIAIGIAFGIATIVAIVAAACHFGRRRRRRGAFTTGDVSATKKQYTMSTRELKAELDATQTLRELGISNALPRELDAWSRPAELAEKRYTGREGSGFGAVYELGSP